MVNNFDSFDSLDSTPDVIDIAEMLFQEALKYDSLEDIKKCLSCDKPECTNCLRWVNGV